MSLDQRGALRRTRHRPGVSVMAALVDRGAFVATQASGAPGRCSLERLTETGETRFAAELAVPGAESCFIGQLVRGGTSIHAVVHVRHYTQQGNMKHEISNSLLWSLDAELGKPRDLATLDTESVSHALVPGGAVPLVFGGGSSPDSPLRLGAILEQRDDSTQDDSPLQSYHTVRTAVLRPEILEFGRKGWQSQVHVEQYVTRGGTLWATGYFVGRVSADGVRLKAPYHTKVVEQDEIGPTEIVISTPAAIVLRWR